MNYKYFLFDLDGTLTDPKEGITNCVKHGLSALGLTETDEKVLLSFIGPPLEESFANIYNLNEEETSFAIATFRERYGTIGLFENRAFDGIREMLAKIKQECPDKKIALATSKPKKFAILILEKYNLLEYFDILDGSNLDGTKTRKDEVIASVLEQLELTEEEHADCLMIGDRKHDVLGASQFGIDCIGVEFGYAEEGELKEAGAKYIVETVKELEEFLINH